MIRTRLIMPGDEQAFLDMGHAQVRETVPEKEFDRERATRVFRASIEKAHPTIFVAEQQGALIGYLAAALCEYSFATGIYVEQRVLYVRPDKRGSRAAASLVLEFIRWGDEVGAEEWLFGVSNGREIERTARFFEKFGAKRVGYHLRKVRDGQERRSR